VEIQINIEVDDRRAQTISLEVASSRSPLPREGHVSVGMKPVC
jgi:hypothetical protein